MTFEPGLEGSGWKYRSEALTKRSLQYTFTVLNVLIVTVEIKLFKVSV